MNERLGEIRRHIEQALRSSKGKDVLLYLICVVVSFVFWMLLSLDTEVQRDFNVPLEIQDKPDSITMIGVLPAAIDVSVKAKESQLLRFEWGGMSPLRLKWDEFHSETTFNVSRTKLDTRLRDYFGQSTLVVSWRPDSLNLPYTAHPGRRVKLIVNTDIHPNFQYIISGPITASTDSVTVYSPTDLPLSFNSVETELLSRSGMKDTVSYEVKIKPIPGVRIIPDRVKVTIPVEPLIAKKVMIPVVPTNVPEGRNIITFPSRVEMSYLVPISAYNDDYPVKAFVNYNDVRSDRHKLPVTLSTRPKIFRSISVSPDSVEFIIENTGSR